MIEAKKKDKKNASLNALKGLTNLSSSGNFFNSKLAQVPLNRNHLSRISSYLDHQCQWMLTIKWTPCVCLQESANAI